MIDDVDFNTPLSTIVRTTRWKISTDTEFIIIKQQSLIDIFRAFHSTNVFELLLFARHSEGSKESTTHSSFFQQAMGSEMDNVILVSQYKLWYKKENRIEKATHYTS